jgi:amino acid efflux transporter
MESAKIQGHLSLWSGTVIILTVILGSGILILPGMVFLSHKDAAIYSWIFCAAITAPILVVMMKLGELYPSTGGVAYYAKLAFGRYAEILVSVLFLGAVALGLPSVAITGGGYIEVLHVMPGTSHDFALILVLFGTAGAIFGGDSLGRRIKLIGGGTLIAILVLLVALYAANLDSVLSHKAQLPTSFSHMMTPVTVIFFSFTGWEIASHLSEDFKNPKKDFAMALLLAFTVVCIVYLGSAWLVQATGIKKNFNAPIHEIAVNVFPSWLYLGVPILGVTLIAANLFGSIVAVSRLVYYLAEQKLLPSFLMKLDDGAPRKAVYAVSAVLMLSIILGKCGLLNVDQMFGLAGQNFLLIYIISAAVLLRLSRTITSIGLASAVILPSIFVFLTNAAILYPVGLAIIAFVIFKYTKHKASL